MSPTLLNVNRPDESRQFNLLLYAAVPRRSMLDQGFYVAEMEGLRQHPRVATVAATNSLADVWRANVDGIISYFYSHSATVGLIARLRGIPVIATGGCEQLFRDRTTPAHLYAARVAAFHCCTLLLNGILATSTSDHERMMKVAIAGRDRIKRDFHGVKAVEHSRPSDFARDREKASLLTIAGLDSELNVRRKGVLEAVDLLARFKAIDKTASLTIVGRDTCRGMVEAHASSRGVVDRIHFTGYVTEAEKLDLLHRCRFYVQLSEYEGFGIGALEALAHGCQVIHTNQGGLSDTIGKYGIILPREEVERFDPLAVPDYSMPDWSNFQAHLAQFGVARRAESLLQALGWSTFARGDKDDWTMDCGMPRSPES